MHLSIVIPAYNEEKRLSRTLEEIDKYLRKQTVAETSSHLPPRSVSQSSAYDYEILVVNDGSKDKTAEVCRNLASKIKNLRLIDNKINQGKGAVVRQGMLEAKGDYRIFTDADNSTSIDQIEKMWPYLKGTCLELAEGFDIIIGSRDVKGAVLDPPQPWIRNIILGEGFKLFRKIVIGLWGIQDTQCGFKCFKKEAADNAFPKCRINRFAFDPEILIVAGKMGYKIKEVPVYWKNDPDSKVKPKWIVNMAVDLFKIRWNLIKGSYD